MKKSKNTHSLRHHIDTKLQTRLRFYFLLAVILLLIVVYNVIRGDLSIFLSLLTVCIGMAAGIISARMFHLSWSHNAEKIVSRLDGIGVSILVLYILFALLRGKFLLHSLQDLQLVQQQLLFSQALC